MPGEFGLVEDRRTAGGRRAGGRGNPGLAAGVLGRHLEPVGIRAVEDADAEHPQARPAIVEPPERASPRSRRGGRKAPASVSSRSTKAIESTTARRTQGHPPGGSRRPEAGAGAAPIRSPCSAW